jgi:hypothetical protein
MEFAETVPLAICLAALKAVGVEPNNPKGELEWEKGYRRELQDDVLRLDQQMRTRND